ncbi:hypothetical protein ScPMuIL_015362 [Solemya velum]
MHQILQNPYIQAVSKHRYQENQNGCSPIEDALLSGLILGRLSRAMRFSSAMNMNLTALKLIAKYGAPKLDYWRL